MNTTIHFRDKNLFSIWDKVQNGTRLSLEDGLAMFASNDVISIGKMAHAVQQMKSGDAVYYVVAHEMAHQYWAHQVCGAAMQGSDMLSESFAQDSALILMEKEYAKDKMKKFL